MAAIKLNDLILFDNWPGFVDGHIGKPTDGWDSTQPDSGNCVTTPKFRVGTKIGGYEDNTRGAGSYIMQYLRFHEGTDFAQDVGAVSDGYRMCAHAEGTAAGDTTTGDYTYTPWYVVTNDCTNSDMTSGGPICFPCADLSHNNYGWFWVGGVCPISEVTAFVVSGDITGADLKTTGDVVLGGKVCVEDDGTNGGSIAPMSDITKMCDTTNFNDLAEWQVAVGWVTNTDA